MSLQDHWSSGYVKVGYQGVFISWTCFLDERQYLYFQEYQIGNKTMVIDQTNIKQTVYMYKCENSTLQIKGKVNSITLGKKSLVPT